jgi:hypothetical protein
MFKPVSGATTRAVVIVLATTAAAATAWSEGSSAPHFHNGRVCWDSLRRSTKQHANSASETKDSHGSSEGQQAASSEASAGNKRVDPSEQRAPPPKQLSSKAIATIATFYRYPMIYRAEAPPAMPPGTSHQPYVQATQGVWYWPGADSIEIDQQEFTFGAHRDAIEGIASGKYDAGQKTWQGHSRTIGSSLTCHRASVTASARWPVPRAVVKPSSVPRSPQ